MILYKQIICVHKTLYFLVQTAFSHANWAVRVLANCVLGEELHAFCKHKGEVILV